MVKPTHVSNATQSMDTRKTTEEKHLRLLKWATVASRFWTWALVSLTLQLPLFDSSPSVLLPDSHPLISSLLRWDAFHFAHIARNGYEYEYQWAFFPGTPFIMRWTARLLHLLQSRTDAGISWGNALLGGSIAAMSLLPSRTLYYLSLYHLKSHRLALTASLLSLLSSSPAALQIAPYTEPFFTFFSYKGMLCCAYKRWWSATICFTLAACFRSNGILLACFIVWGLLVQPYLDARQIPSMSRMAKAMLLTLAICSPLAIHQYVAYRIFCKDHTPWSPAWCHHILPSIYSYVQSTYWNSGLFRYWTLSQLPNIMLASPILALLFAFGASYLTTLFPFLWTRLSRRKHLNGAEPHAFNPFLHLDLAPHVLHGLLMSIILLCASHTQITLRQAPSMPLTYWAAAWLLVKHPICGHIWVAWSAVWGAINLILWATFLPPA